MKKTNEEKEEKKKTHLLDDIVLLMTLFCVQFHFAYFIVLVIGIVHLRRFMTSSECQFTGVESRKHTLI